MHPLPAIPFVPWHDTKPLSRLLSPCRLFFSCADLIGLPLPEFIVEERTGVCAG
jgi:hypothetical protein